MAVGDLGDDDVRHEVGAVPRLVVDPRRARRRQDRLAARAAELLLDVELPLDDRWEHLVQLGELAAPKRCEVAASALRAGLLLGGDLVVDLPGDELPLLLGVLSPLLEGSGGVGLDACLAERLADRRHLLGSLPEDVALKLLESGPHRGHLLAHRRDLGVRLSELGRQPLGPFAPLAAMFAAPH